MFAISGSVTATITGQTVLGGSANHGGGIYNAGTLIVSDPTIENNSASVYGGGISSNGMLTITDSTIDNNSGSIPNQLRGGGIENEGMLTITGSAIENNSAYSGGGIDSNGTLTISDSTIDNNSANSSGGGILAFSFSNQSVEITSSTIANNTVQGANGYDGPYEIDGLPASGGGLSPGGASANCRCDHLRERRRVWW